MNERPTRRHAIKAGIGIAASVPLAGLLQRAAGQTRPSAPRAFVTDNTGRRHARFDDVFVDSDAAVAAVISINTHRAQQSILGFGAALTEGACTVLTGLTAAVRADLLDELYNPLKSNFSVGRLCLGASDYSTVLYSYDEGTPDPDLSRFSIDHDRAAVLPVLTEARRICPDLFLFASPWSPPGWMKYSNTLLGGSIRPGNLAVYAQYIVRYLKAYAEAGINVDAMTIQNEVDADQYGAMPACTWSEEIEASYIVHDLCPALAKNDLKTQVWILDHNYDLWGRVLDLLDRPGVRKCVSAVAWHGYAGSPDQMLVVQRKHPDLDMHWTEGGDDIGSTSLQTNWSYWAAQFAEILSNGAKSITTWNLALDEAGKPNIGPFHCAGVITIDSHTKATTRNGIFWALSHYARAMPRGSRVLPCTPMQKGKFAAVAATRPDGSLAVVLSNDGPAARVRVEIHPGNTAASFQSIDLPAHSVITVLFP